MPHAHFHDVDGDFSRCQHRLKIPNYSCLAPENRVMLPAHFDDVTYDHICSKTLQELTKSPVRKTRAILKSNLRAKPN